MEPPEKSRLSFSVRLLIPFSRLLRQMPSIPSEVLDPLDAIDPDERIPITAVHELLAGAIQLSGDLDIGLKAAREITRGDYGVVEYAVRSAATWSDAANTVGRYLRLLNNALRFSLHADGDRGVIQLDSLVPLPRASADYQSAAFHIVSLHMRSPGELPEIEAWFMHERPADVLEYERTFPGATLRFEAPFNGFTFPLEYLAQPIQGADPNLHALIRKHAEAMLAELPRAQNLTERVRDLLTQELAGGSPTLNRIARQMSVSESTLARHLDDEGTSFKALLEDLRRRLALRYVRRTELPISEIAFLLGFSQAAAFHRAFRRWTDQTPLEYRRAPQLANGSGNDPG